MDSKTLIGIQYVAVGHYANKSKSPEELRKNGDEAFKRFHYVERRTIEEALEDALRFPETSMDGSAGNFYEYPLAQVSILVLRGDEQIESSGRNRFAG